MGRIEKFTSGKYFIFVCAIYFFVVWLTKQEAIGLAVAALAASFIMIFFKNITGVVTIFSLLITGITLSQLPVSFLGEDNRFYREGLSAFVVPFLSVIVAIFAISVIIHLVRFKGGKGFFKDPINLTFAIIGVAILAGGLFSGNYNILGTLLVFLLYGLLYLFYLLARQAKPDFDIKEYAALLCLMVALSGVADMIIYYSGHTDLVKQLINKSLVIGWAMTNSLAPFFVLAVPMAIYLYIKTGQVPYLAASIIVYAAVFFTVCRGDIFIMLLTTPAMFFCLFYFAKKEFKERYKKKKWEIIITFAATLVILGILVAIFFDFFSEMISRIAYFTNSGRTDIRIAYQELFTRFPIFGQGFTKQNTGIELIMPHSVLVKIFTATGVFGVFAFMYYYYVKYRVVFTYKSTYNAFLILSLFMFVAYVFADPGFYYIHIHMVSVYLLEAARREKAQTQNKMQVWDKLGAFAFKNTPNKIWTFLTGLASLAAGIMLICLSANEIHIISESVSYFLSIMFVCVSAVFIMPVTENAIISLLKKKNIETQDNSLKKAE